MNFLCIGVRRVLAQGTIFAGRHAASILLGNLNTLSKFHGCGKSQFRGSLGHELLLDSVMIHTTYEFVSQHIIEALTIIAVFCQLSQSSNVLRDGLAWLSRALVELMALNDTRGFRVVMLLHFRC